MPLTKTYIATVQIVISPIQAVDSQAAACDWFSGLLSENPKVLDWQYLKLGGQRLFPNAVYVDTDLEYQEGDAFNG